MSYKQPQNTTIIQSPRTTKIHQKRGSNTRNIKKVLKTSTGYKLDHFIKSGTYNSRNIQQLKFDTSSYEKDHFDDLIQEQIQLSKTLEKEVPYLLQYYDNKNDTLKPSIIDNI